MSVENVDADLHQQKKQQLLNSIDYMSFQTAEMGESKHTRSRWQSVAGSAPQSNLAGGVQEQALSQPDAFGKGQAEAKAVADESLLSRESTTQASIPNAINRTAASSVEVKAKDGAGGLNDMFAEDDEEYVPSGGSIAFHRYFEYNSTKDNLMLAIGTFGAVVAGLFVPTIALIMGTIAQDFGGGDVDADAMSEKIAQTSWLVAGVSIIIFVFAYIFFAFWQHVAENISLRLRKLYLRALLHQEIGYFEHISIEQIPAQMAEIFETVQSSVGEKYATLIFALSTAIGGCLVAFFSGRTYAAVLVGYLPVFFLILGTFGIMVSKITAARFEVIKQMGGVVSETLYAIKVVASFGRENKEIEKFLAWTKKTEQVGKSFQRRFAFMIAIMKCAIFSFYTFAFYVGSVYIQEERLNPNNDNKPYVAQDVLTVLIALITGFLSLIAALPNIQAVQAAKQVGKGIFDVLDRVPRIRDSADASSQFQLTEAIEFINVSFKYPTAPKEQRYIFDSVNFKIPAGESTAIVGPSGFGKSTIVQMIERFYDPVRNENDNTLGQITFDGQDIKSIKLKDLREAIGYVPQEPTLIIGTIRENLLFGNKDASDEQIKRALEKANAEFVFDFERGLDTFIGTSSVVNLSGGQKQRLAIARALLKNPKILILDEATSALDPQSEKEVQGAIEAIENAHANGDSKDSLTVLIIAHRLTSIKSARNLLCIERRDKITSQERGTAAYDEVLLKLKNITYAHGEGEEEEVEQERLQSLHESVVSSRSLVATKQFNKEDRGDKSQEQYVPVPTFRGGSTRNTGKEREELNEVDANAILFKKDSAGAASAEAGISVDFGLHADSAGVGQRRGSQAGIGPHAPSHVSTMHELALSQGDLSEAPGFRNVGGAEIMAYYTPKWLAVVGIAASVAAAGQLPIFGFLLSKMVFTLMIPLSDPSFETERDFWVAMFGLLCCGIFLFTYVQKLAFGYGSENLTYKVRALLFEAILYKHIGWFDSKDRAPGVLGNIIQEDIAQLNGLTSETYGVALEAILGLVLSSALCLWFSWQVGLITIILSPMMVFGGFFMSSFQWSQGKADDAYQESNALLSDIIMNYRTIISLGEKNVDFILAKYNTLLEGPNRQGIKRAHFAGLLFGYSQSIRFVFVALSFYFAALIIEKFELTGDARQDVFTAVYVMFVGAIGAGVSVSQMPSMSRAKRSANKIFAIIEEKSQIDPRDSGSNGDRRITRGEITLENVSFRYPSRRKKVLDNFSLKIQENESVALVGHSGSGKSTIASLLLRFYNKQSGKILIDGKEIESYSVKQIREQIAIVMQEPLLFNEPIKENIRYGNLDASDSQVLEVADQANCLNFIQGNHDQFCLPEVKAQILKEFEDVMALRKNYPNLSTLDNLVGQGKLVTEEIFLVKELLECANEKALQIIDSNVLKFVQQIMSMAQKQGDVQESTWEKLLMTFVWRIQICPNLEAQLGKNLDILDGKAEATLRDYLDVHCWKFDAEALTDYFVHLRDMKSEQYQGVMKASLVASQTSSQREAQIDDPHTFSYFLRTYPFSRRFKTQYEAALQSLSDPAEVLKKQNKLHPGFNKLCGLRGCRLSGGQKQRVAIARALIRNPKILILDEATSALDEKSQEIVQQALELAMTGRTSIVIAHRLSTVKKCNKVVVLHNGRLVEEGTYDALSEDPDSYFFKLKAGLQMND